LHIKRETLREPFLVAAREGNKISYYGLAVLRASGVVCNILL
jgi:hypothetical protein